MLKYIRACDDRRERTINLLANWGKKKNESKKGREEMKKVKIYIDCDEYYPFYYMGTNEEFYSSYSAEISEQEYAELKHIFDEFERAQKILRKLH